MLVARSLLLRPASLVRTSSRCFSARPSMSVFDRDMKQAQRTRHLGSPSYQQFEYFRDEVARRLIDRLRDIRREFPVVVDLGCNTGNVVRQLEPGMNNIQTLIQTDMCATALERARERTAQSPFGASEQVELQYRVVDEEQPLPFEDNSVDLVVSCLSAHWVNNLPLLMTECKRVLKPDGAFLCAMLGGETLYELRSSFAIADQERHGGVSPHVSPFVTIRDIGDLLASAGFTIPTLDLDTIVVRYPDMFTLLDHIQGAGDGNVSLSRAPAVSRDVFTAAAAAYQTLYRDEERPELITATFQVLNMIGWVPDPSQPKPKDRGSATVNIGEMAEALESAKKQGGS